MKIIGYAYPTSPLAVRLKRSNAGCYYVADVADHFEPEHNFVAVDSFSAATEMCKGAELSKWSLRDPAILGREMQDRVPLKDSVFK